MGLRKDEHGVSEIVGALMLVVVVSSAAFGFGVFMHQQSKLTQEQKAAENARKLEVLEISSLLPDGTDFTDLDCAMQAGDADWNTLTIGVTSRHLKESILAGLTVNGHAVGRVKVGATAYDLTLAPDDPSYVALKVPARQTVLIRLENVADDTPDAGSGGSGDGCLPGTFSFVDDVAAPPLATSDALQVQMLTSLNNVVVRPFIPPTAIVSLTPTPGGGSSYNLVGSDSTPGSEDAYIVRWEWYVEELAGAVPPPCSMAGGVDKVAHIYQFTVMPATSYCFRLVVRDNSGLESYTDLPFSTS